MDKLSCIIDGRIIEIYCPTNLPGNYAIIWDKIPIGFMHVSDLDQDLGTNIWIASTPYVNLYLDELAAFIESSKM